MKDVVTLNEALLIQTYWGVNVLSALALVLTIGIMLSCLCRLNSTKPRLFSLTLEQFMYLFYAYCAGETFMYLLFFQLLYGYSIVVCGVIMLHLATSAQHWRGDDCVCDALRYWSKEARKRRDEIRKGIRHGRRSADQH